MPETPDGGWVLDDQEDATIGERYARGRVEQPRPEPEPEPEPAR